MRYAKRTVSSKRLPCPLYHLSSCISLAQVILARDWDQLGCRAQAPGRGQTAQYAGVEVFRAAVLREARVVTELFVARSCWTMKRIERSGGGEGDTLVVYGRQKEGDCGRWIDCT